MEFAVRFLTIAAMVMLATIAATAIGIPSMARDGEGGHPSGGTWTATRALMQVPADRQEGGSAKAP
jgi:hypothetical protein